MNRAVEASRGRAIEAQRSRAVLTLIRVAAVGALLGIALGAALTWATTSAENRDLAQAWLRREINQRFNPAAMLQAQQFPQTDTGFEVAASPEQVAATGVLHKLGHVGLPLAVLFAVGLPMLLARQWVQAAREAALDQVKRGNRVATPRELTLLVNREGGSHNAVHIGGVPIPSGHEHRHGLFVGASGSGKTTAIRALLQQVEQRGEHALIYDPDGSYIERFYQADRDIILNPWDARTARWNPLSDVHDLADAQRIAAILIPKPKAVSESAIWYEQVRAVAARIMLRLVREGRADLNILAAQLATASVDELRTIVAGTPAGRAFEPGADKAASSVAFMLTGAADIVGILASVPNSAAPFNFDRFYQTLDQYEGAKPFIFLAAPSRARESAAPIVTAWVDAAAAAILQRPIDTATNAWMILDEVASLPPIQSLLALLPLGRKYHACVVLALQSVAQLRQTYGNEGAEVVSGQTATQVLMAVGDHATAQWAVNLAGTAEVERMRPTETLGSDKNGHGSLATGRDRLTLLLDSELTSLKPGQAYLRLAGQPLAQVTIDPPRNLPAIAPGFIPATWLVGEVATMPTSLTSETASRSADRPDWLTIGGPF